MDNHIGFHLPPKMGIWRWIRELHWNTRYAFQRAWRGYDNTDVFDLGFGFLEKMPVLLKEFLQCNEALFHDPITGKDMSKEETDAVLREMIWNFEGANEDVAHKRRFGTEYGEISLTIEQHRQLADDMVACREKAMELFSSYLPQLWY